MSFSQQKHKAVNDYLASCRVGDVDAPLIPLLDHVNSLEDFYSTSSCSGRMAVMESRGGKGSNRFIGKWHEKIDPETLKEVISASDTDVWFKSEPPILHIVARTTDAADKMLHAAREAGFKRSGLQSIKEERNVMELLGTEFIHAQVVDEGKVIVSDEYLSILVESADKKLEASHQKLEKLLDLIKDW
ncbi:hypothetical protein ACFLRF_03925 [Candidatus Altiarchaeota archaeon]